MDLRTLIAVRKRLEKRRDTIVTNTHTDSKFDRLTTLAAEHVTLLVFDASINEVNLMIEEAASNVKTNGPTS